MRNLEILRKEGSHEVTAELLPEFSFVQLGLVCLVPNGSFLLSKSNPHRDLLGL